MKEKKLEIDSASFFYKHKKKINEFRLEMENWNLFGFKSKELSEHSVDNALKQDISYSRST